jgi:hypothetical protein|tara:strand:- start:2069 stop:2368 length:300 start_codon:yes stop_codon:yes gene_type:complete
LRVVWDGIDEGFVGLRIDNCASIILELQMDPVIDPEAEPASWLDVSDISIEFDRQDAEFTLKPGQLWAEQKCQLISNERIKIANEVQAINRKVAKSEEP